MTDGLSPLYQDLLGGSYDCVDRIVLNAYFRMGHDPGGFLVWWRALTGSDETLENAYLMRLAGRFSRRLRGYAKAHDIPVIDCPAGQRKHDLAEEYLAKTRVTQGLFLVLVGRAQAPVWDVSAKHHIERKKPMPYVNHYSFHILDPDWGHLTIKISGHPPFPAQVILNGHEYVACQARKASIAFTKEGNCLTTISDAAGLAKIADTLSEHRAIGRLSQVCERWIYTCVCFALDFDEQKRSGFHYQYSNYQIEYSRNLVFEVGRHMEQVFQALIDRSRAPLDLTTINTIPGAIDLNKARMPRVIEPLLALSSSPNGFTASEVAARVRALSKQSPSQYGPRHAAYDLKKLRGKHIIRRIGHTRRYEPLLTGLRAMTALLVLRDKAIKPLLAAAQPLRPKRGAHNPKPIDLHYDAIQAAMKGVFHELGLAA